MIVNLVSVMNYGNFALSFQEGRHGQWLQDQREACLGFGLKFFQGFDSLCEILLYVALNQGYFLLMRHGELDQHVLYCADHLVEEPTVATSLGRGSVGLDDLMPDEEVSSFMDLTLQDVGVFRDFDGLHGFGRFSYAGEEGRLRSRQSEPYQGFLEPDRCSLLSDHATEVGVFRTPNRTPRQTSPGLTRKRSP